ncbi:hypothetical protein [Cytobacillus dafuensis]|uniref:Uncharacterized protein n=1 Tax=Cytobacillus dafuensis TaxID=1742359 RepID=A0A5B8ZCP1_CYTDA|nr:hypothetical protein [Cytobacillus dafuensis]QED49529.1 hypothetical protein FSZ17_20945 [Cytobacillus dafuensis]
MEDISTRVHITRLKGLSQVKFREKHFFENFSVGINWRQNESSLLIGVCAVNIKRNRGAVQESEYSFFYNKHLPIKSRLVWDFLKRLMDKVAEPQARRMKF